MKKTRLFNSFAAVIAAIALCGCVDEQYNLANGISIDVSIPNNKFALPLGDLKMFTLDSLLTVNTDMLTVKDDVYGITLQDSIPTVSLPVTIDPFRLDTIVKDFAVNLGEVELDQISIPGMDETFDVDWGDLTMDKLNESLPVLEGDTVYCFPEGTIDALIELIKVTGKESMTTDGFDATIVAAGKEIPCDFQFEMPSELKTVRSIMFSNTSGGVSDDLGTYVQIQLFHPSKASGMPKTIDMTMAFPEEFDLALDPKAEQAGCYSLVKGALGYNNMVMVKGFTSTSEEVSNIGFYARSVNNIDGYIVTEELEENGDIPEREFRFSGGITYSLNYNLHGSLTLSVDDAAEDYGVQVKINSVLGLRDAAIELDAIPCDFPGETFDFSTELKDVKYVDSVGTIKLNPSGSRIRISTSTDTPVAGLRVAADTPVLLRLPKAFHMNPVGEGSSAVWDAKENTLAFFRLEDLVNASYEFEVSQVDVCTAVRDNVLPLAGEISIGAKGDQVMLESDLSSLSEVAALLGKNTIHVAVEPTTFDIDDVDIYTSRISEAINDTTSFDVDIPVGNLISKAYAIYPEKDIEMSFLFDVEGLEAIDTKVNVELEIGYPPFLCLETNDPELTVGGGKLKLMTSFQPDQKAIQKNIKVTHFDFTKMSGGCLEPVEVEGEYRLKSSFALTVDGAVALDAAEVSLADLGNDLSVHTEINFSEIKLRRFEGVLSYDIEPIETSVDLAADESLSFLSDENVSLTLSDPQLFVDLKNSVGVPVDLDILIEGLDASGQVIPTSVIDVKGVQIAAASFDAQAQALVPETTRLLFTNKESSVIAGYTTVAVENLANLLKVIPASIRVVLKPSINKNATHYVDIAQALEIGGSYKVAIPLKFDQFNFHWKSGDNDINISLGDSFEGLTNWAAGLKMNVRNTIPFGVELRLVPLDKEGKEMSDISISPLVIPAGTGVAISRDVEATEISFRIDGSKESIVELAHLRVEADVHADHTEGGIALKPEQGILLTDIVLQVEADIEINNN